MWCQMYTTKSDELCRPAFAVQAPQFVIWTNFKLDSVVVYVVVLVIIRTCTVLRDDTVFPSLYRATNSVLSRGKICD